MKYQLENININQFKCDELKNTMDHLAPYAKYIA